MVSDIISTLWPSPSGVDVMKYTIPTNNGKSIGSGSGEAQA